MTASAAVLELVAFGVPSEIVVVVENQHLLVFTEDPAEEVGGGKTGDPAADDDEVILLSRIQREASQVLEASVSKLMRDFERTDVTSAETRERGRIVRGLGRAGGSFAGLRPGRGPTEERRPRDPGGDAVDEVAPGDVSIHSELAVTVTVTVAAILHVYSSLWADGIGVLSSARAPSSSLPATRKSASRKNPAASSSSFAIRGAAAAAGLPRFKSR